MAGSKSIPIFAAAVLARIPNFILPIFAARIFDFSDYSTFALAFATASAMAAFLGEAISVTISRESCGVNFGQSGGGVAAFFCASTLVSYLAIIVCLCSYQIYFVGDGRDVSSWLIVMFTILLVPAYLLPAGSVALAHAHGMAHISAVTTLVGVPISLALSLYLGMTFGLVYFFAAYSVSVIFTNVFLYIKVVPKELRSGMSRAAMTLRSYAPAFLMILGPFMLGGPIHGLCLSILNRQEGGGTELAIFVAYYPWAIVASFVSGVSANYVIQKIGEIRRMYDVKCLRKFLWRVLVSNALGAVFLSVLIYAGRSYLFSLYKSTIIPNEALLGWILVCGVGAAYVSSTSQIIIGIRQSRGLLMCAISHAILYTGLTFLLVGRVGLGAVGLAQSLSVSLFVLALAHLLLIVIYLRRSDTSEVFSRSRSSDGG